MMECRLGSKIFYYVLSPEDSIMETGPQFL
jgi:hypothetical protein